MDEVPEINVYIVPSNDPPKGAAMPGVPPLALRCGAQRSLTPLTGKRIRKMPITKRGSSLTLLFVTLTLTITRPVILR
jgi:CO/xanthine dehydrogenase Mo-binding subunit